MISGGARARAAPLYYYPRGKLPWHLLIVGGARAGARGPSVLLPKGGSFPGTLRSSHSRMEPARVRASPGHVLVYGDTHDGREGKGSCKRILSQGTVFPTMLPPPRAEPSTGFQRAGAVTELLYNTIL